MSSHPPVDEQDSPSHPPQQLPSAASPAKTSSIPTSTSIVNFSKVPFLRNKNLELHHSDSVLPMTTTTNTSTSTNTLSTSRSIGNFHSHYLSENFDVFSLADFKLEDKFPRRQRKRLLHLHKVEQKFNPNLKVPLVKLKKDKKDKSGSAAMSKIGAFLNKKKMKQKSSAELFHILNLSLQDERLDMALASVEQLTTQTVKKKRVEDSNQAFLLAITKRAESIALRIYEKGFPPDCNAPVLVSAIQRTDTPKFIFPSYFLLAVAFGLSNLVNAMLKRANVNQTWYGLTPLLLASCTMGKGNHNIVSLLLENGADPSIGIQIDLFLSHKQLKIKNRPKLQQNSQYIRNYSFSSSQQSQTSTLPGFSSAPILQFGTTVPGVMESLTRFKKWSQDKVILPLDVACSAENSIAVKSLLKCMDSTTISNCAYTFIIQQDPVITILLWKNGGNFSQRDWNGLMGIHTAARTGNIDMVMLYLTMGVEVDAPGENGWTALHEAVSYRCMEVAHLLIRKGASKSAATALGETVTDIARKAGMSVDELDQLFAVTTDSPATPKQLEREAYIQEAIRLVLSSSPVNSSNVSENGLPFTRSSSPQPQPAKFHIRKRSDTVPVYLPSLTPSITPATLNSSNDAKNKNKEAKKKKNRRSTMSFGFSKKDATKNSTSDSDFTSSNSSGGKSIGGIDEVDEKGVESSESNKKTVKKSNSVTFSLFGSKEKG